MVTYHSLRQSSKIYFETQVLSLTCVKDGRFYLQITLIRALCLLKPVVSEDYVVHLLLDNWTVAFSSLNFLWDGKKKVLTVTPVWNVYSNEFQINGSTCAGVWDICSGRYKQTTLINSFYCCLWKEIVILGHERWCYSAGCFWQKFLVNVLFQNLHEISYILFPDPQLSQFVCQNFKLPLLYMTSFVFKSYEIKFQSLGIQSIIYDKLLIKLIKSIFQYAVELLW